MEPRDQRGYLERQPAIIRGGRPLLFERLCSEPGQRRAAGFPDTIPLIELKAVSDSVARELRNLLNTRLPVALRPGDDSDDDRLSILSYGIPDFSGLSASSPGDRAGLARVLERRIEAFEPRLRQVHITLEADPIRRTSMSGSLTAHLQLATLLAPVSFPLILGESGVTVQEAGYAG
jgi:type VI secretion system protein ImpF